MTVDPRKFSPSHLVVGCAFITLGVIIMLDRLGIVAAATSLKFWPIGLVAIGLSLVAQGFIGQSQGGNQSSVPVGGIFWLVILGVFLTHPFQQQRVRGAESGDGLKLFAFMGGDKRAPVGAPFHQGEMTSVMGGTELDLRQSVIAPGEEAAIDLVALMGGAIIRVPPDWKVDVRVTPVMGGVKDERRSKAPVTPAVGEADPSKPAPPRLILRGVVVMGGVVIKN